MNEMLGIYTTDAPANGDQPSDAVLPEWENTTLGEISHTRTGPFGTLLKASEYSELDGVPMISVREVGHGKLRVDEHTPLIPREVVKRLPEYLLKEGDVIFGRKGAVDRSALVSKDEEGWFLGSDGIRVRLKDGFYPPFFAAQFQSRSVQQWLLQNATGTTMASLNQEVLGRVRLRVPPFHEQNAIAAALKDIDDLIASLDALIAKKRDIKQAAMQQLLTGKTRLPGFEGEWVAKRLATLGTFLKGSGVRRDQALSGDIPCVRYGEIYTDHDDVVRQFKSFISPEVAKEATPLQNGDLLFAGSGETKEEIGKCVAFVGEHPAFAGGDIIILRPNWGCSAFLGYLMNAADVARQKANRGQGDAVVHISAGAIGAISALMPEPAEQAAIAEVLTAMDEEIEALNGKKAKTAELKDGMMQQLLTGRIRLA